MGFFSLLRSNFGATTTRKGFSNFSVIFYGFFVDLLGLISGFAEHGSLRFDIDRFMQQEANIGTGQIKSRSSCPLLLIMPVLLVSRSSCGVCFGSPN